MSYSLKCPDCSGKFPYKPLDGMPRYCPLCKADMGEMPDDSEIVMPAFLSAKSKQNDKLQRDIVQGSHTRAELAAQMAGCEVSDMASLKINDLNTSKGAPDMAPKVDDHGLSSFMETTGIGGFKGSDGLGYSGAVATGPFANSGAKMRTALQEHHAQISRGTAVSDRPAVETTVPTYRRRG